MRHTKQCPKCGCKDIALTTGKAVSFVNTIVTGATAFSAIVCDKTICLDCGYVEQWVHDRKDLEKIRRKCERL